VCDLAKYSMTRGMAQSLNNSCASSSAIFLHHNPSGSVVEKKQRENNRNLFPQGAVVYKGYENDDFPPISRFVS